MTDTAWLVLGPVLGIIVGWGLGEISAWRRSKAEHDRRWDRDRKQAYVKFLAAAQDFYGTASAAEHHARDDYRGLYEVMSGTQADLSLVATDKVRLAARELYQAVEKRAYWLVIERRADEPEPPRPSFRAFREAAQEELGIRTDP